MSIEVVARGKVRDKFEHSLSIKLSFSTLLNFRIGVFDELFINSFEYGVLIDLVSFQKLENSLLVQIRNIFQHFISQCFNAGEFNIGSIIKIHFVQRY